MATLERAKVGNSSRANEWQGKSSQRIKLTAMQSGISNTSYYALLTSIIAISQDIRPRTTSYFILSYPISAKNLS